MTADRGTAEPSVASEDGARTRRRALRPGRALTAGLGVASIVALAGCTNGLGLVTVPATESQATIIADFLGSKNLTFEDEPTVTVQDGRIDRVVVTPSNGSGRIGGSLEKGGKQWTVDSTELDFGTSYDVKATAVDLRGKPTTVTDSFKTFVPEREVTMETNVWDGSTYGVGMPITVTFSEPIQKKADIESRLHVNVKNKKVDGEVVGAWNWETDQQVTYRPKKYWPANSKITLDADIRGVHAGDGAYPMEDQTRDITIGSRNILTVDTASHQMTFNRNGKNISTIPISSGRPGMDTRNGTWLMMSKERNTVFTADTAESDPEYYRLNIDYAMRFTWSGQYLHSAPWSVGSQGYSNVSHGCVNMSTGNAAWVMNESNVGDVIRVVNSPRPGYEGDGWTQWMVSWKDWKSGSALEG